MLKQQEIQEIRDQALKEIEHAQSYKNGKIKNWQKNEEMYYGKKTATTESRANVDLGRMQEFVHTLLSKVNDPLIFKFTKRKDSQLKRTQLLNALVTTDKERDNWDIKDMVAKKQCILYGRGIAAYTAADEKEIYKPRLEIVDVYDFLIDPAAGGIDLEKAFYMGRYGVIKTRKELEAGIKSKDYIKSETQNLLDGVGNNTESLQLESQKNTRQFSQNTVGQKELQNNDKFKFWEWFTTYKGERYYVLINTSGCAIRIVKLTDMFESGLYPFWTYAAFPDLTEFWTPSFCDYVREMFMVQNVSINQMLDNAEAINKPQKVVNVGAIEDLSKLKYRRDGLIFTKGDFDANRAIQILQTPSINTPIQVFDVLERIQEKASGVTSGAKGVSDETGKVGIYQGNQQATADRFKLFNTSYSFGTARFARLWECGVKENLTKRVSVTLVGPEGTELVPVRRSDLYKKGDEYGLIVEASRQEMLVTIQETQEKLKFLASNAQNPIQNPKKAYEISAKVAGFSPEDTRQLMDTSEFGNSELMAECDRDIESLLEGDYIKPNAWANNAYKQRMVDYLKNHDEDISREQFTRIAEYIRSLDEILVQNEVRAFNKALLDDTNAQAEAASMAMASGKPIAPNNGVGLSGPNQINNNPAIK